MIELLSNPVTWLNWFAPIVIIALAKPIYKFFISLAKNFTKKLRLKELKKLKNNRRNPYLIHSQISKSYSYFTLFSCSILFFYFALFSLPFLAQLKNNNPVLLIYMVPVLFLEVLWINQDLFTKNLILSASKVSPNPSVKRDWLPPAPYFKRYAFKT